MCFMLFILFVLVGCNKINNRLKQQKYAQLDKVYEELDYKEYSLNDWDLAINYIKECKKQIMLCEDNSQIDKIYDETISKIHKIKSTNEFKTLDFKVVNINGCASFNKCNQYNIIDNYNELVELFSDENISLDKKEFIIDNYNSDFFKDKTVLVYFYYCKSSNIKRYISEVSKYDYFIKILMNIELYYNPLNDNALNDDAFVKPIIIEFNKNDISSECNVELYEKQYIFLIN